MSASSSAEPPPGVGGPYSPPRVRLVRAVAPPAAPPGRLDAQQAAAVAVRQQSGALVVLGAPGTGKTTTLVEAVVARVERDGVPADGVLMLAASRTAAAALRERVSARLARTVREPPARTLHSYAFGLLRRQHVLGGDVPPRLISGPEQDRVLADLLAGHLAGAGVTPRWPATVAPEVRAMRGFRDELRDLLMRAVERGLCPADLAALGRRQGRPEWVAAADVLAEYLDVTSLATPGAYDPAGIVDAAARLLGDDAELLAAERARWAVVAADDLQETTAAGQRLLEVLAGGGHDLLLAGDPDAATQGFRGARPQGVADAAQRFARPDGSAAAVVVLRTVHRQGPALRAVAVRVAERIGSAGTVAQRAARPLAPAADPSAADPSAADGSATDRSGPAGADGGPGEATVRLLASAAQEAAYVAQRLRHHHLHQGVAWSRMAVVVRSGRATQALRRALGAAGVPVTVAGAEVPVRDEPAVVPLRLALRCCLDPVALSPEVAAELLGGPLAGVDAVALRRLRQGLRAEELAGGGGRSSDALLVEALGEPGRLVTLDPRVSRGARRLAAILQAGREAAARPGATAETVLWALWEAAGVAQVWQRQALRGGAPGARADRDLDAVVALFDAAARYVDRLPRAGPAGFLGYLEGQDLPADTLAERAPDGDAVALVTAQAAAGREWDVVAVPGVQEGSWPDLRLRSSLLGAQALADLLDGRVAAGVDGVAAQRRAVLDDELRLFHVAVTRARRVLLVTAVRSEDELPSPFLDLVDPLSDTIDVRPTTVVPRAMTLPALVAELRAAVVDRQAAPQRRRAAADRLAELAAAGVPGAHPRDWYGLAGVSAAGPLRDPQAPVAVSPSRVEQFDRCGLRWLLETSGGTAGSSRSQLLGTLVHELAERAPEGTREELRALLQERIDRLGLGDSWVGRRDRERLGTMVDKLAEYLAAAARSGNELVAVEQAVQVTVGRALVRGLVDRLERDPQGRLVVVDLKTGKSQPSGAEVARHAQLGVYQVAVAAGGFESLAPGAGEGGAVLVQLGSDRKHAVVQRQAPIGADADDPGWAHRLVQEAAEGMAGARFTASGNPLCRMCAVRRSCPLQPEGRQVGE